MKPREEEKPKKISEADKIWLTIKQNNNYEISNGGEVRNRKSKKLLKPAISNKGYYLIALSDKGKSHTYSVHKLVMEHFYRCARTGEVINHIDCNKENNNVNNLEWCTQKHNVTESFKNGLQKAPKGKESTSSKKVRQYDLKGNFIKEWDCTMDIQRKLKYANQNVSACCRGEKRSAYGFVWRYVNE